ncbi:MAG TPA: hypothetical protein VIF64_20245 [Pyrinomonadaceae bacterium]|jgi:sporulation protein YlmC with PRC-barrel domain
MSKQEINLELLLGRRVLSLNGRSIGRVEEVQAELRKGRCFVTEFHVGSYAMLERLAAFSIGRAALPLLRARKKHGGYRIAWDQLDFSNPDQPRLNCEVNKLKPI